MEFSEEQKDIVKRWVKEGCGLSEVQKRLSSELDITMTYMDVRFLILDLGVDIQEEEDVKPADPPADPNVSNPSNPAQAEVSPDNGAATSGGVQVEVDVLMRPGALLSGTVVFSDGVTAVWMLDQSGRLGIEPSRQNYAPTEEDNAAFVKALQDEVAKKGL